MLWNWLRRRGGPEQAADERVLALEREAQSLRLELEERDRALASLKGNLERQRGGEGARVADAAQAQIERMLADAAAPVAQLLTQAHLLEVDGRPVQPKDLLAVAKRLVRTMEDIELTLEGGVGETVSLDPDRQEPLSASVSLNPGDKAMVRFVGVSYKGKVLRKAGVEKIGGIVR